MNCNKKATILIVDDYQENLSVISQCLKSDNYNFVFVQNGQLALDCLAKKAIDIILLDLSMPGMSGEEVLLHVKNRYPNIPVIIVTATKQPETIVDCIKKGADDYLIKPLDTLRVVTAVQKALATSELKKNYESLLSNEILHPENFSHIITNNDVMIEQLAKLEKFALTPYPVLITGETGVGKELFSKAVHEASGRTGAFCAVNVAGIDDHLFSDIIFGHKKGAFTGANHDLEGILKKADGGTVFMDEVGDLSIPSQIKLLRLIQDHEYYPLGVSEPQVSGARIVMATNRSLAELKEDPNFRKDFFYRIAAHHIRIPSLKERVSDIGLLFDSLLEQIALELNLSKPLYSKEVIPLLQLYNFPGNVRELEQMLRSVITSQQGKRLCVSHFYEFVGCPKTGNPEKDPVNWADSFPTLPSLKEIQDMLVKEALKRTQGNASNAAKLLGITRSAMSQRLKIMNESQ